MLEKLKELLGDALTDELSGKVSELLSAEYVTKADHDTKVAALTDLEAQLKAATDTIAGYKDMDIETIKKSAEDWRLKAEQAEKDAAAKVEEISFSSKLAKALTDAKGKNEKSITALLDLETLKQSKNQDADIAAALAQVKKDADYLFGAAEPAPPYAAGTGTSSVYLSDNMAAIKAAAGISHKEGV